MSTVENSAPDGFASGSEGAFRALVDSVTDYAIFMVDPEGRVNTWNKGAERLQGYEAQEIVGKSFAIFYTPEAQAAGEPQQALNIASAEGSYAFEGWRVRKDGSRYWADDVLTALYEAGRLRGFAQVTRDTTQKKWDQERFRVAVESAPNAMVIINREGRMVLVNAQAERMFGYRRDELLGRSVEMLVPQRFRAAHPGYRATFFHSPSTRAMGAGRDLFGLRRDGTEIPVEIGLNPIRTDEGDFVLAAIVDITERKRAEERFRVVVESAPNAMVMVNAEGRMVLVNAQTEKLFGYGRADLLGNSVEMLVPERFRARHPGYRTGFFAQPQTRSMGAGRDLFGLRRDGTEVPVEIGLNPIRTAEGDFVLAAIVDITERKRSEQERLDLDRAKTVFFSNVSHEFRTPLTLLLGPLEELLRDPSLAEGPRGKLETVQRNAVRLLKLVNTLLDFSRIEAGRVQASYEPTDLAELTAELASVFRSAVERAGLRLVVDCPPLREPVYVDREMWEKIVFNLLSNALKFTLKGGIEVSVRKGDGRAELAVRDTGTGVPPEELPRLFERFYRVRNPRARTQEGTGIGLALVQELARLHGGSVSAESRPGEGSTFTVSLPLGIGHLPAGRVGAARPQVSSGHGAAACLEEMWQWIPELGRSPAASAAAEPPPETAGARILLAEDNADMRDYVSRLLRERWAVEAASDGAAALEAARQRVPDLVLSDVLMPGMDGFELLRELRRDPRTRTVPVILLSARAGEEFRVEGLQAGADDYLVKPFTARELLARVQSNLELSRLRRQVELETRRVNETLEARVEERTRELKETIQELETFTYSVAHDLRAPLRAMHRFSDLLIEEQAQRLDEDGRDYLKRIAGGAARMDTLIDDLLAYSRIPRSDLHPEPLDARRVIAAVLEEMAEEIRASGARVDVDPAIPPVYGDRVFLAQVVRNLLGNAVKFVPAGRVPVVRVRAERVTGGVRLWVEDNGIGIDPKYSGRLFRVFERLHGAKDYPGTGVGLAIVRKAVERMGGRVGFEPASDGPGTRFWIELPAGEEAPRSPKTP